MTRHPTKMDRVMYASILLLFSVSTPSQAQRADQTRWSRQISSYTSDIGDWVPLAGPIERSDPPEQPIKRQAVAQPRILSEPFPGFTRPTGFSQDFPSRNFYQSPANRQLYLQSVPSAPQNYLTEQSFGQGLRFGLTQPNFPLSQGFVAPSFTFDGLPQIKQRPQVNIPPVKFDSFPKPSLSVSPQAKPFINTQILKLPKAESPKFVDGYRVENTTAGFTFPNTKKKPQSLQKLKLDTYEKLPKPAELTSPLKSKLEREEVQLLYVPVESLNRGQFNFKNPLTNQQIGNSDLYSPGLQKQNAYRPTYSTDFQRPISKPVESYNFGEDYFPGFNSGFELDQVPKFSTVSSPFPPIIPTTSKPKKLKPHQPPLAVFLVQETKKGDKLRVADVLTSLKHVKTIAVLDTVSPGNSPKVFIGPSSLSPPENYVKFELPYLSNIEHSDKKLRQLPFFVAPLSYHTPDGFAKIPFPSPHVGSVIVNSQIKDSSQSTPIADVYPNSYTVSPPSYTQEKQPVTQKPTFSYYSTLAPKTNSPSQQVDSSYYSFEPQTVTSIRPSSQQTEPNIVTASPKNPSYFLKNDGSSAGGFVSFPSRTNQGNQYNTNFGQGNKVYKATQTEQSDTPRSTVATAPPTTTKGSSTAKAPSTYPSQLLETHNPYSINQAFHLSTPLDYQSYFDEYKEGSVTPGSTASTSSTPKVQTQQVVTEKQTYKPPSFTYTQNYSPEIHYGSEIQTSRFPTYESVKSEPKHEVSSPYSPSTETKDNAPSPTPTIQRYPVQDSYSDIPTTPSDTDIIQSTGSPNYNYNNQYVSNSVDYKDINTDTTTTSTTTTTTTTRRTPIRTRGRPHKYTTQKSESHESSTRTPITRRPLKERRPLPTRTRYESNKITTERPRKHLEPFGQTTTKSPRTRTRGRLHYKSTESGDETYDNKQKGQKEEDLAYQRDVLHQNYPVTLMERMSTVDIEAITEPTPKFPSTRNPDRDAITQVHDTENAYSAERTTFSKQQDLIKPKDSDNQSFVSRVPEFPTDSPSYVPRLPSSRDDQYIYQSRSSPAQIDAISYSVNPSDNTQEQYIYTSRFTTPITKTERPELSVVTVSDSPATDHTVSKYSDFSSAVTEDLGTTIRSDFEITKINNLLTINSYETNSSEQSTEEIVTQTTLPQNRVRTRPGAVRHYQASSTEEPANQTSVRAKTEFKRRPIQPVTYRPAFDRRRTTMRIEEIEADLKTKQVHVRPDVSEHRHPVYKPEPTTEPTVNTASSDSTTKRGQFRRRRPQNSSTTTSTESSVERKKPTYETRNRFRGRRPTEKSTEKSEVQSEVSSTTSRNVPYNRYSNRPKLSDRFNRRPATTEAADQETESEDQDRNYSINRPKYAVPDEKSLEDEKWSPNISTDSFKPYNPNDIHDDKKIVTTEIKSTIDGDDSEDIITARNDYDDILISVTPASNRLNKKIPEIPPTLEALVEQSKTAKTGPEDTMSTFESMLEEVMKSLEEQDEDEYTTNVMKHKGGEIGEIPPEKIIFSGDNYSSKPTTLSNEETPTTIEAAAEHETVSINEEEESKGRRRGFWKKVKVRPVTTESFEVAESQFYSNTINRLGDNIKPSKASHDKYFEKSKPVVTTYKPKISLKELQGVVHIEEIVAHKFSEVEAAGDTPKLVEEKATSTEKLMETTKEEITTEKSTTLKANPGEMDLGTGSPDPTIMDIFYSSPTTETSSELSALSMLDRSDGFSFMDYLFGVTSPENDKPEEKDKVDNTQTTIAANRETIASESATERVKDKVTTTEISYIPDEITASSATDEDTEKILAIEFGDIKKVNSTEAPNDIVKTTAANNTENNKELYDKVETSSVSSYLDPKNVVSTSMSTEISHETEICFRGKCIKTSKDLL